MSKPATRPASEAERRERERRVKGRPPKEHRRQEEVAPQPWGLSKNNARMDQRCMRTAIEEARLALRHDDVPVGAVVVHAGEVVGAGHNERERRQDPTAHAETLALRRASERLGTWRRLGSTPLAGLQPRPTCARGRWRLLASPLYVWREPCAMCAGAIVLARVARVVYGTTDPKAGAAGSVLDVLAEPRLNHRPAVEGGVLAAECAALLTAFFASRRG